MSGERVVVERGDAIANGLTRYYTGRVCKAGHLSERWSLNGACIACTEVRKAQERATLATARLASGGGL